MNTFRLLRPEELLDQWENLNRLLLPALDRSNGELLPDDIRDLVLSGRMFVFTDGEFAVTTEFVFYPRRTVMVAGFGAGKVPDRAVVESVLTEFARRGGAVAIQTYCKDPAMLRYYRRWFHLTPTYTLLEKQL